VGIANDRKANFENFAMNLTESKAGSLIKMCPMNEMVWKQDYHVEKIAFAMAAIILNILSFPVTILMNVLAIMARPRLQGKYNILLACLAGTDLLVGAALQPTYIAEQIYVIKGLSLIEYCQLLISINIIAELLHARGEQAEHHR